MKIILLAAALLVAQPAWAASDDQARLAARARLVTITRDEWGIAHVKAPTDADAVFGMAFAQAEDDFNRVETNYLTSLGRLSEAEGEKSLWKDLRQRLWTDPAKLRAQYAASPAWLRKLMDGWADGLNYYLATHPGTRPRVLTRFEPWMALSFSEGSIGGDIEYVDLGALRDFYGTPSKVSAGERPREEPQGSNGMAIAPKRTADGKPLLLINPHTSFFFRDVVQVTSGEGLNVYGAVTWGQFFVYQGFNRTAGWMHTSSGLDNRDEFVETRSALPGGKLGYRYGGKVRAVTVTPITIQVRQSNGKLTAHTFRTLRTHHGPIVRSEGGKWIAYAILDNPVAALEQSFLRTKARNLAEFMAVAERRANSSNNTLFADSSGTIAYLHPQFVPVRDNRFDYTKPVDGSDPATDWRGLHEVRDLPNVVNPASGFVFNSNDAPWPAAGRGTFDPAKFPRYMDQWGWNARTDHALRVLEREQRFTPAKLIAAAYDREQPGVDLLLPGLIEAFDRLSTDDARRASFAAPIAMLRGWDRRWSADSEAQTLAVHWGEAMWKRASAGIKGRATAQVYAAMQAANDTQKLEALTSALDKLRGDFGSWRVKWGDINRFQRNDGAIVQTFDDAKPSIAVPFPSADWGSLASFGARTYPGTKKRYGTSGNSFVAVVEFGKNGPRGFAVTAGGVNGDPRSPHFADQAQAYADGRLLPVHFETADVAAHARAIYHPGERR